MSEATAESFGTALPKEMARVRDKVLPAYLEIGMPGMMAAHVIRTELDRAAKALAEGDVVEMIRLYASLKEWSV